MTAREPKRSFASRPGDAESWIKTPETAARRAAKDGRLHGPPHHRRHARTSRSHQGRRIPPRRHRRRHAPRDAGPRISAHRRRANMINTAPTILQNDGSRARVPLGRTHPCRVDLAREEDRALDTLRRLRRRENPGSSPATSSASIRAASSPSCVGRPTTTAPSSRASTSCALSLLASRFKHSPSCAPAATSCCAPMAGRRWSACSRRSMLWRRSASMPTKPPRIIGATSTTG